MTISKREFNSPNDPNAGKLIESLRHLGYDNYVAIADIVDNSLDADAKNIRIRVWTEKQAIRIMIADDGTGMDKEILDQALRLGSLAEKNAVSDLGKFGMGLVTAGLSIARKTTVITKQDKNYLTSIVDIDKVIETNTFCKYLGAASQSETEIFDNTIGDSESGTMVLFDTCDGLKNQNITVFANTLKKHLGRIHRYFIQADKHIFINGDEIVVVDPLELNNDATEVFSDEEYSITVKTNDKEHTEKVRIRIALIEENKAGGERDVAFGIKNQGFYILRNNREIKAAEHLEAFTKHNDFNRMRGEIFLSGDLDEVVGIDFTKRDIVLDQSFKDQLLKYLKPQCSTIKRQEASKSKVKENPEVEGLHQEAQKYIDQKAKLLILPKTEVEKRSLGIGRSQEHLEPSNEGTRGNFTKTKRSDATRCKFNYASLGPQGQIYIADLVGRTIVITWNIDHPFYQRFVLDQRSDGRLVTAVDYLIYSMASAELTTINEDNLDLLDGWKAIVSANIRTLLS